ncbi:glucose-6-phosphate dehydrogenase [Hellea balneolensis]|uniref:glucose-6-phosphate dehydrogenase n=1 Tax=Hellea balneolensis TaxID=287478 RepID=UPI00040ECD88|nr:glucose-6-phosphate dehydrogenase [Hellea balneolensis]
MTISNKKSESNESSSGSTFVPVEPFEIVVFGGTGDLARRKLLPSLYHRYRDGQISDDSRIVGVSRSQHSRAEYQELIEKYYHEFAKGEEFDPKLWAKFIKLVDYVSIDVMADKDWSALGKALSGKSDLIRVFYLAMPPRMFADICDGLKTADLVHEKSRVVLEKPLGTDYDSAREINEGVGRVFKENNIYRIDHYLGKETVQNLLVLRFGNILLEPLWSNQAIDHIEITAAESIGVGGRGSYYDGAGALRDMVQNHLLQLLCLTAMEAPSSLDANDVRTEKIKVLRALRPITPGSVKRKTVRGQYARGKVDGEAVTDYMSDVDVTESSTETYVAIKAEVDNWRWAGVPIYLRTGKRMSSRRSEIVIQFKSVPHSIFGDTPVNPNKLVIRLQPDEAVKLWFEVKEPGAGGMRLKTLPLNLSYADNFTVRYPDAYERLLMDVVRGNLSLFMRRDEVESAWKWVDGILEAWEQSEQRTELYAAGSEGPAEADDMLSGYGHKWSEG